MVIIHLIYDTPSLLACSLTCYSWYMATVSHLHHTLITQTSNTSGVDPRFLWPRPLSHMHRLGLLPLVKKFHIRKRDSYHIKRFTPQRLSCCTLRHFLALTGVQELGIDHLNIPTFIPRIQKYFGHFLPTVRSLALRRPKGSNRHIIYFIGLFEHLDDLKLLHDQGTRPLGGDPEDDRSLLPFFTPPLRGQLTITRFTKFGLLRDMIDLFGGIRFRRMDLADVDGTWLLLDACAKTLETLRLYPTDLHGMKPSG